MATLSAMQKHYSAYKSSGTEWLGDVPSHWEVQRVKWIAELNPSWSSKRSCLAAHTPVTFLPMEKVGTEGQIDTSEKLRASQVWNGYTYFRRGDILVAKITPCFENGKGAYLNSLPTEVGFGSTEFHVLRATQSIDPRFLYLLTTDIAFRQCGTESMTGAAGQKRVSADFVANYQVPLPPLAEQRAIATFLDRETAKINALVSEKERLIELLQEKRTALISHIVTKGLDPNAPMKDSDVEWIGEIPAHWEVKRLKHVCSNSPLYGANIAASRYQKSGVRFLRTTDIAEDGLLKEGGVFLTKELVRDYLLNDGDLLISRSGTVGRSFLYQSEIHGMCAFAGYLIRFVLDAQILSKYIFYFTKTQAFCGFLGVMAISSTIENVNADKYANAHFPLPTLAEQHAITVYLNRETAKLDSLISKVREAVELLEELRTALISAAVTGKIDVREEMECT